MAEKIKTKLLTIHALLVPGKGQTYFALPYNPYGVKSDYKWTFTKKYMDLEKEVLVGEEFWDLLGGEGTYQELISIFEEVKREKGTQMLERLGF